MRLGIARILGHAPFPYDDLNQSKVRLILTLTAYAALVGEGEHCLCVFLCGSPVWPSPPMVIPLRGPPLCVGPLRVRSSPVVFPFPVASVPRLASRSRSRSRCSTTPLGAMPVVQLGL